MGGVASAWKAAKPHEDLGEEFSVSATMMSGREILVGGLHFKDPVRKLKQKVADILEAPPFTLTLCLGSVLLEPSESTLQDFDISEGTNLTVVKRKPIELESPGESRYNKNYVCTVLRVREVADRAFAVEFEVVGNKSLGRLQDPLASELSSSSGGEWSLRPASHEFTETDFEKKIRGTLVYDNVPAETQVRFKFGNGWYSYLTLELGLL